MAPMGESKPNKNGPNGGGNTRRTTPDRKINFLGKIHGNHVQILVIGQAKKDLVV